ncbi:zinc finger, CCHC-type containing protein [Tanacetum coccineum]
MASGVPIITHLNQVCEGCVLSKQTRIPFPEQAVFRAKKPLELIHADLCGPITPTTVGGSKYFLLLVDDFSRWSWVYTLTGKFEAFEAFKRYKKMVEESSAPYSPQQNGVVERRNRTVMEMARSLLKGRNVPGEFWGEAVRHAVYHLNRLPSKSLPDITPYEAWYGKKPNLEHLKIFSCVVFAKCTSGHIKKLDDRSKKMVYFGVEDGTKGNQLYDPQDKKLRPSTFEEAVVHKAWREAMQAELDEIKKNKTCQLTSLPPGHKAISLKWVYKVKKDNMGNVVKYKARLVAKGSTWVECSPFRCQVSLPQWRSRGGDKSMKGLGFLKSSQDPTVYTRNSKGKTLIVGVYVDDLIITGSHTQDIVEFKEQMKNEFKMSDLGLLAYYLGIEVSQKKWGIALRQTCYARKLLEQFGMQYCNLTKSPMEPKLKVDNDEGGEEIDSNEYRRLVGCLRYLTHTRPDLSYSVGITSRFMEKPITLHFQVAKRILRYIKGTLDYGIKYEKGSEFKDLVGFTDSDHGGDPVGGKSIGGMIFYLGRNAITWQSKKQKTVALSSCEAEFMAATSAACQAIWLANLVKELTGQQVEPTTLFVDNKSAIALMKNPVSHGRSKHINIHFHFIRECVKQRKIIVEHVNSKDQRADLFTKALALVKFIEMRNKLGLTDTEPGPI